MTTNDNDKAVGIWGVLGWLISGLARLTWWALRWSAVCWTWTLTGVVAFFALRFGSEGLWQALAVLPVLVGCGWLVRWSWEDQLQDFRAFRLKNLIFRDFRDHSNGIITSRRSVTVREGSVPGVYKIGLVAEPGFDDDAVLRHFPVLASDIRAKVVHVPDNKQDGIVEGRVITRDLLAKPITTEAPVLTDLPKSAHDWITVGIDSLGEAVKIPLFLEKAGGMRMTIAGRSGSGKNSVPTQLVVGAILSDQFDVWIGDPKQTEFRWAEPHVQRYETEPERVASMIQALSTVIRDRQAKVAETGHNVWKTDVHGKPLVVVLDEGTAVTTGAGGLDPRKVVRPTNDALVDIAQRARSAGVTFIFMTQQLSTDAIPSAARANFDLSLSMSVRTNTDAEMAIPGSSKGQDEYNPACIGGTYLEDGSLTTAGVFVLGGMLQTKARSYFIPEPKTALAKELINRD